jgi:exonuclease SbcD
MSLVQLDAAGQVSVEVLPFTPIRRARVLRGKHAELLLADPSSDFVKAVLTDDTPVIDGMKRLRGAFPNVCELIYARDERPLEQKPADGIAVAAAEPVEVVRNFLIEVGLEAISETEQEVVSASLSRLQLKEDAE